MAGGGSRLREILPPGPAWGGHSPTWVGVSVIPNPVVTRPGLGGHWQMCSDKCNVTAMGTRMGECPLCGVEAGNAPMVDAEVGRRPARNRRAWWTRQPICAGCATTGHRPESADGKTIAWIDVDPTRHPVVACEACGQQLHMEPDRRRKRVTCSNSCRQKTYKTIRVPSSVTCDGCGNTYEPARSDSRFCSPACRQKAYRERHR